MARLRWPIHHARKLWHVGTMNPSDKRQGSQEGAGLSVSRHPDEWREIGRGVVGGDTWVLRKSPSGRLLDFHELSPSQSAEIASWGLDRGLVIEAALFEVSHYDDELETDVTSMFTSREQAEYEAEGVDGDIAEVPGFLATDALRLHSRGPCEPIMVPDMIAIAFAELELDLDGCWWSDILDPIRLSAPRGVLFPKHLDRWSAHRE